MNLLRCLRCKNFRRNAACRHIAARHTVNVHIIWNIVLIGHAAISITFAHVFRRYSATFASRGNTPHVTPRARCLLIVNCLVTAWIEADGFWLFLFNVIGHKADMRLFLIVAFILKLVYWQTVVGFANLANVFFQAAIRKQRGRLLGRCG